MKLSDIVFLVEITQDLYNAVEYDCDTPLHYAELKEWFGDFGYHIQSTDVKMIDECAEIIRKLIEENQSKINIYDMMTNEEIFNVICRQKCINNSIERIGALYISIEDIEVFQENAISRYTTSDTYGEQFGGYFLDIAELIYHKELIDDTFHSLIEIAFKCNIEEFKIPIGVIDYLREYT